MTADSTAAIAGTAAMIVAGARIYGDAYNKNPEFYAFLCTLESYREKTNMNSVAECFVTKNAES